MYEILRDKEDGSIASVVKGDVMSIPLDPQNRHYQEFLAWVEDNPNHGLNLDPVDPSAIVDNSDPELEALRAKLEQGQDLTREELRTALLSLL